MRSISIAMKLTSAVAFGIALTSTSALAQFDFQTCHTDTKTLSFTSVDGHTKRILVGDWNKPGGSDCELQNLELTVHDDGTGTYNSSVCTHFTHGKDIWHTRVVLLGAVVNAPGELASFQWDGPKMSERDKPLYHPFNTTFTFNKAYFPNIRNASITGCC